MKIRQMVIADLTAVIALWNASVKAGEVVYREIDEAYFEQKFLLNPSYDSSLFLVAEKDNAVIGFISGVMKKVFLANETHENTPGYVTVLFVDKAQRLQGIGTALLNALETIMCAAGKKTVAIAGSNPVNLDWIIPGTPGHDHNNAPGMDVDGQAYPFFVKNGFEEEHREVAMYLDLKNYVWQPEITQRCEQLAAEGVYTGDYDVALNYDFNGMCDRIPSEYWRASIATEIKAWKTGKPTTDIRFLPNGKIPAGPRPLIVATHDKQIVGFTGPVDMQASGRGFFTGICTDPLYERRGIATVLFNLLMQAFVDEGASFSTLFTGDTNHAQKLYLRTGFVVAKRFAMMSRML